ncbi:beta-ketoacyl-ACP synthase III, putative, partial [Plasmodium ovale curtisi]
MHSVKRKTSVLPEGDVYTGRIFFFSFYASVGGKIVGHGHSYPENEIPNDELKKYVDTSDEWIRTRTGIRKRRILKRNENISMLQIESASKALKSSSLNPLDVDM